MMRKILNPISLIAGILLFSVSGIQAQQKTVLPHAWMNGDEFFPGSIKAFEENKGQFVNPAGEERVLFGCYYEGSAIYFTEKGIVYSVKNVKRDRNKEEEEYKSQEEKEKESEKAEITIHNLKIEWENANPHPRVTGEEETPYYFSTNDENKIKGFRKIIYHDLYPGIDLEFKFHENTGLKYSFLVKPGYAASAVVLKYSGHKNLRIDKNGNLLIKTPMGTFTDHAPVSYQSGKEIATYFLKKGNDRIQFNIPDADIKEPLLVDPWLVSPTTGGFAPVNVGVDAGNNVYVLGAYSAASWDIRQFIQKYNSAGALQWTYTLSEFVGGNSDYWLSDLAVSPAGDCYVATHYQSGGRGICPNNQQYGMVSVNASGARTYWNCPTPNANQIFETWNLAYSCNYSTLIQGGCAPSPNNSAQAAVMNPANGTLGAVVRDNTIGEIYAGTVAPNGYYYALAADSNINATTYQATTGPHNKVLCYQITGTTISLLWWKNTNYSFVDFTEHMPLSLGTNGIAAGCNYLYTSDGLNLDQRNLTTGVLIKRISIPSGNNSNRPNINSGIAVDLLCGYVYVGTRGTVYIYDPNLNQVGTYNVGASNIVYDVKYNNGIISVCGATNSAGNWGQVGQGFVAQFTALTCTTSLNITHTNAGACGLGTATANPTFCAPTYSYLWMPGGQTTQTATGLNPGTYTVTVRTQNNCVAVQDTVTIFSGGVCGISVTTTGSTICPGATGTISATGAAGTAPYTYSWQPGNLTGTPLNVNPTVTTTYTVIATDSGGQTASATAVVTVLPTPTVTATGTNICPGGTTTLTGSGANTYTWQAGTTPTIGNPVTATPSGNTTYTVTGTSTQGCTNSTTVAVIVNPQPVITVASISLCKDSTGTLTATGANTYTWMTGNTNGPTRNVTPNSTGVTTYTITGTSALGCTSSTTATVTANDCSRPTVTLTGGPICLGSCFTLQVNATGLPPLNFTWIPNIGSTAGPFTVCPTVTTTYTVMVSDLSGNSDTAWAVVTVNLPPTVTSSSGTICINSSTGLTAGGASTYTWAPTTGIAPVNGPSVTANPAATTTYTVTGTDANGCTNTSISVVTVNPLPVITTTNGVTCSGYAGTVSATGAVSYTWQPGNTNGPSLTTTPTGTTTYTVSGTDANGCINSSTAEITVVTTPTVTVNSPVICVGATATLTAGGTTTYTWLPGNTTSNPITVTPTATTTYTVIGSIGAGCSNSTVSVVTVNPLPTITSTSGVICIGATTNLSANGGTNYSWTPGTGLNTTTGPGVTASPNATTTYTITGIDINGCLNTSTSTVTVNSLPTVTSTGGTVCQGQSVTLNAGGASTYAWQPGGGSGSTITVNPTVTTTYTVTGTDANGCVNVTTAVVVVNPIPSINATGGTVCAGSTILLNASGAVNYTWYPSGTTGGVCPWTPSATTTFTVIGSTAAGCTNSTTTVVNVEPIPIVNFEPDTSGCVPLDITFSNNTISTLGSTCFWRFGDGSTSTSCVPTHSYTKPGTYDVTLIVTSPNGCKDTLIRTGIIRAFPLPIAGFTATPWEAEIMDPRIKFFNQSTGDDSLRIWCFGDGVCDSTNIMNPIHTYEDTGRYNVCLDVMNRFGCTHRICHDVIIKPIWTFYIPNAFTPNGDGNNDTFNGKGYNIHDYKIWVFDRWGNLIFESNSLYLNWNGKANGGSDIAQEDVYVWVVQFKDIFNKQQKLTGSVTLIK